MVEATVSLHTLCPGVWAPARGLPRAWTQPPYCTEATCLLASPWWAGPAARLSPLNGHAHIPCAVADVAIWIKRLPDVTSPQVRCSLALHGAGVLGWFWSLAEPFGFSGFPWEAQTCSGDGWLWVQSQPQGGGSCRGSGQPDLRGPCIEPWGVPCSALWVHLAQPQRKGSFRAPLSLHTSPFTVGNTGRFSGSSSPPTPHILTGPSPAPEPHNLLGIPQLGRRGGEPS